MLENYRRPQASTDNNLANSLSEVIDVGDNIKSEINCFRQDGTLSMHSSSLNNEFS